MSVSDADTTVSASIIAQSFPKEKILLEKCLSPLSEMMLCTSAKEMSYGLK